ncbi:MAG: hypothetical protein AB8B91_07205 [Rubripirellula sp.]
MDELSRSRRFTRRFALAALIACSTSVSGAEEPATSSFKNLLSKGWEEAEVTKQASPKPVTKQEPVVKVVQKPVAKRLQIPAPPAQIDSTKASKVDRPAEQSAIAALKPIIVRGKLKLLEVPPEPLQEVAKTDGKVGSIDSAKQPVKPDEKPSSLAQLIKERTKSTPVPVVKEAVKEADVTNETIRDIAKIEVATDSVQPVESPVASSEQSSNLAQLIKQRTKLIPVPEVKNPVDTVDVAPAPEVNRLDVEKQIATNKKRVLPSEDVASIEVAKPIVPVLPKPSEIEVPEEKLAKSPEVDSKTLASDAVTPKLETVPPSLQALNKKRANAPVRLEDELRIARQENSPGASIHATRLHKQAREALHTAKARLQKQATHSAQKYALDALRSIVAMQDARVGGNTHSKALDVALDSIREAEDFCGRFGSIDQRAMKRMVTVHETSVLKDQELENLSAIEATEAYLVVARENLVLASAGSREASNALVLLGQIEKLVSTENVTHSAAVAVMLQRSAIEIDDQNGQAFDALGLTFLQQGLAGPACWALKKSIDLQPTRSSYQKLLEASRRMGDADTARICNAALRSNTLPSDLRVQKLSPAAFAATHRPNPATIPAKTRPVEPKKVTPEQKTPQRVSLRTLFPFSRR